MLVEINLPKTLQRKFGEYRRQGKDDYGWLPSNDAVVVELIGIALGDDAACERLDGIEERLEDCVEGVKINRARIQTILVRLENLERDSGSHC